MFVASPKVIILSINNSNVLVSWYFSIFHFLKIFNDFYVPIISAVVSFDQGIIWVENVNCWNYEHIKISKDAKKIKKIRNAQISANQNLWNYETDWYYNNSWKHYKHEYSKFTQICFTVTYMSNFLNMRFREEKYIGKSSSYDDCPIQKSDHYFRTWPLTSYGLWSYILWSTLEIIYIM